MFIIDKTNNLPAQIVLKLFQNFLIKLHNNIIVLNVATRIVQTVIYL